MPELHNRVHLVGIGGAGMSALARVLLARGAEVSGSDAEDTEILAELRELGITVWSGVEPERVTGDRGLVVRSAAVSPHHPEVSDCRDRGFDSLLYSQALGQLTAEFKTLAIAGTHGKTTTTAMLAAALRGGEVDASHIVGGDIPELGGSGYAGTSPWLCVEACEFDRSFHRLHPRGVALLNFDHDHFDCYPTRGDLLEAYAEFARRVPPDGLVVVPADAPTVITDALECRVLRIGWDAAADLYPEDPREELGAYSFEPSVFGRRLPRVTMQVPGLFQVYNALCALALARWAGATEAGACRGLQGFRGVRRRFEVRVGPRGGVVVNDYAHHPVEIEAVIAAARQRFPGRTLLAAFQPHQHQRTSALLPEFAGVLAHADHCLVADIYGAREADEIRARISASDLVDAIRACGRSCDPGGGLSELPRRVVEHYRRGDVVLMLGAGDIGQVVDDVVSLL